MAREDFDADFMFLLTAGEMENLRCKKFTSSWGEARHLPHAFTEQGVYIVQNRGLLGERELLHLSLQTAKNVAQISESKLFLDNVLHSLILRT